MAVSKYAVFRYRLTTSDDTPINPANHFGEFEAVRGEKAAYRVRDPAQHDHKHFIFDLEAASVDETEYFAFGVGYQVTHRPERQFDPKTEKINLVMRDANDMRHTRAVIVPSLGVSAFRDGSGDDLNATGGVGRVEAVFEMFSETLLAFDMTASNDDVNTAVARLRLVEMRFEVRPFNPHPSVPGLELSALLSKAKVGRLSATAKPTEGGAMAPDDGGLVSEAQGLSNKGYGHFGITAKTEDGATVVYKKQKLVGDKEQDAAAQEKPRQLLISVEKDESEGTEESRIVRALLEIHGKRG